MARKAKTTTKRERITVFASTEQKRLLTDASAAHGTDLSTLVMAYTLRGMGAMGTTAEIQAGAPLIVSSDVGDAVRRRAAEQGVTPDRVLELMLVG